MKGLTSEALTTIAETLTTDPTCSDLRLLKGKIFAFEPGPGIINS